MQQIIGCPDFDSVEWRDTKSIIVFAILAFMIILVIVGNSLVIAAVFYSHKLRSVTNYFIVSLAVADLLVGLVVLPFSATREAYVVWIFGDLWCRIWTAVDVWMCTASILNLCAISLDRYVAVTRPVTYPSIMSTKRAKLLVAGVWVLSFVICCPPLISMLYQPTSSELLASSTLSASLLKKNEDDLYNSENFTLITLSPITIPTTLATITVSTTRAPGSCPLECELINDKGYVIYSALGSFFIPMFVMLFFYWRIYRAAVRTTRAINQGYKTITKVGGSKGIGERSDDQRLTLRIHRGRGSTHNNNNNSNTNNANTGNVSNFGPINNETAALTSNGSPHSTTTSIGSSSPERFARISTRRHDKIKISVSYPSTDNLAVPSNNQSSDQSAAAGGGTVSGIAKGVNSAGGSGDVGESVRKTSTLSTLVNVNNPKPANVLYAVHYSSNGKELTSSEVVRPKESGFLQVVKSLPQLDKGGLSPKGSKRLRKRNVRAQAKRFRMETKAAKTLAIIVGLFILCWLPFFSVYLVRAFCNDCITKIVWSIIFWLGYCNSAINPFIYAKFSKDFRAAFKQIISKVFCSMSKSKNSTANRRDSDMSQFRSSCGGGGGGSGSGGPGGGRTPSLSPSIAVNSLGEDSDHVIDLSDCR